MPIMSTSTRETLERIGNGRCQCAPRHRGHLLTCLMLLTAVDVVMRYIFNSPIRGSFEIAETSGRTADVFRVSLGFINNQHVCIDLLNSFFSPTVSRI